MGLSRTTVNLDDDLTEWHKNNFPGISLSATLNNLLNCYKEVIEAQPEANYYLLGAKRLKEQLDKDLHE
jgi:hypothetical protein